MVATILSVAVFAVAVFGIVYQLVLNSLING